MNSLLSFSAWQFAAAGALLATAPVVIHLLNRRRFRVVHWAAMDFLREAMQRNRRMMQLRDMLLLALRTLALLLFGLALARPYLAVSEATYDRSQPLHAIVVVDNSMSMGYETLAGNLLDQAKKRAEEFIKELPRGSMITVAPLAGSEQAYSLDPYRTTDDAVEALKQIEVVDRPVSVTAAVNLAKKASDLAPELAKRIVFLSDQQQVNWRGNTSDEDLKKFPEMQVVDVSGEESTDNIVNTWISDFRLQDGVADVETAATFIVELRHQGPSPRRDVQVTLAIGEDEEVVATETVTLEPGTGARELTMKYTFDNVQAEAGKPTFVAAKVSIPDSPEEDKLPADNARYLAVPVVAALPIVFVDQYGEEEQPNLNKYGETWPLRRLLAPVTDRGDASRQFVEIRQATVDTLSREMLEDARLVVVAGVADPASVVTLLREYVQQGGQLVIAAGGDFRPEAWNDAAWLDGQGILPLPVESEFVGVLPEVAPERVNPFQLSFESMQNHAYFNLAGISREELSDTYSEPFFFQAIGLDERDEVRDKLLAAETERLGEEERELTAAKALREKHAELEVRGEFGEAERIERLENEERLRQLRPNWLTWASATGEEEASLTEIAAKEESDEDRERELAEQARATLPVVRASFDNGRAFLVERSIGRGRVMLVTSSVYSDWNTLSRSNAMLLFDRVLRGFVESTLPRRTFAAQDQLTLTLDADESANAFFLARPIAGEEAEVATEELYPGYLGANTRGLTITNPLQQGIYQVTAYRTSESADDKQTEETVWRVPLAVNAYDAVPGAPSESELTPLSKTDFDQRAADSPLRWVGPDESISLAGTQVRGQNSWVYLVAAVLLLLLAELLILAWPQMKPAAAANAA